MEAYASHPSIMSQRLRMLIITLILLFYVNSHATEAPDGSVCFNNCNGHGDCVDYSCNCWVGYHGDDCSTTFVTEGERVVPILSAGHYNLTRKNFTSALIKNKLILVGFSAYSCFRCIVVEFEYEKISTALTSLGVPFARADADKMKSLALEHGASELPALVLFQKNRPLPFIGSHTAEAVLAFVDKQMQKPTVSLKSVEEVERFLGSQNSSRYASSTVMVVGFFADRDIEEDDYDDYVEVAKDLQVKEDVYFATVTDPKVCEWFKRNKTINRTPSVLLLGENGVKAINLDELYGEKFGLKEWINRNAIPLVGKLTNSNFHLYEKIPTPMLLLFLDLTRDTSGSLGAMVGGRSGSILNENLIEEFRHVAKEHSEKITFVYLDGLLHEDRMKSLGLFGGKERLPSLAFNTRDNLQIPFSEELPINRDTLLQFCADFLSGKLKSAFDASEMAKKVMQSVRPVNLKNRAKRKEKKTAPKEVRGVSEQYEDGSVGDLAVTTVTLKNFEEVVMDEGKDVMLMLHSKGCESCSHFAVYYKHMAARFKELQVPSLVIARMDLTDESPPNHLGLVVGPLPLLIMLPAGTKSPPWTYYSGVGKVAPLMKWAQEHAAVPFALPNLPHLSEEQTVLYKQQVREREEHLETKRREEKRAVEGEDRARKEAARKLRNKLKKAKEEESSGVSSADIPEQRRPVGEKEEHDEEVEQEGRRKPSKKQRRKEAAMRAEMEQEEGDRKKEREGEEDSVRRRRSRSRDDSDEF